VDSVPELFVLLTFVEVELPPIEGVGDHLVDGAFGEGVAPAGHVPLGVEVLGKGLERVASAGISPQQRKEDRHDSFIGRHVGPSPTGSLHRFVSQGRMAQGVPPGRLLRLSLPDVPGEVAAILLVQRFIDPLAEEVPVAAADDTLGDEHHHLAQPLHLLFVAYALRLVPAEPGCVVHQEHIKEVKAGILDELAELFSPGHAPAADKLVVPPLPQYKAVALCKSLDIVPLDVRARTIPLVKCGVPDVAFSPKALQTLEGQSVARACPGHCHRHDAHLRGVFLCGHCIPDCVCRSTFSHTRTVAAVHDPAPRSEQSATCPLESLPDGSRLGPCVLCLNSVLTVNEPFEGGVSDAQFLGGFAPR